MTPVRRRLAGALGFAAVLGVAAWARLANVPAALGSGDLLLPDGDCAYHLLRIRRTVERFPHAPTFDPQSSWPNGGMCPWTDGFDVGGAAFVLAFGGAGSRERADVLAALYPVVLGLLLVWATIALARAVAPDGVREPVALAAGLLVALLPHAVMPSRFARVDHHVLEALAMTLLARWSLTAPEPTEGRRRRMLFEAEGALLSAGALYVFTGATVYVAIAAGVLLARALAARPAPPMVGLGAPGLLCGAAVAAALSLPLVAEHGRRLSYVFPSMLQPALLAAAAAALALAALAGRLLPSSGAAVRGAATLAAGIALAGAATAAWRGPGAEVVRGIEEWLLHRDPWLSGVEEFQPLFSSKYEGVVPGLYAFYGVCGWAVVPALALGSAEAARARRGRGLGFLFTGVGLLAMTVVQVRFGRVFAPFVAVAVAMALAWIARVAATHVRRPPAGGAILVAALGIAVLDPRLRSRVAILPPVAPDAIHSAALDLRDGAQRERGSGPGVATRWDFGHHIEAVSGRPVVANGFGSLADPEGFREMVRMSLGSEADLYALLSRRDLGFVVGGAATMPARSPGGAPLFERREDGSGVFGRTYLRDVALAPLVIGGSGVPDLDVPHLSRLLPRFASAWAAPGLASSVPVLWVYERVPGATLAGTAAPGARVVAELPFQENGRPHAYRAFTVADRDGRWRLVLPLPSGFARPTLSTGPAWRLRAAAGPWVAVAVAESAVRAGTSVAVGSLPVRAARAAAAGGRGGAAVPGPRPGIH